MDRLQFIMLMTLAFLLIFLPVLKQTIDNPPSAEDWSRHSLWISQYISGDFSPLAKYPPFFHFIMLPFYWLLGNGIKVFQLIFCVMGWLAISWLSYKYHGRQAAVLTGLMLSTSIIFVQYAPALMPQALDYILFPVAMVLLFRKSYKLSAGLVFVLLGGHNFGVFSWLIMFIYSIFRDKKFIKYLLVIALLYAPLFLYSNVPGLMTMTDTVQQFEDKTFIRRPWGESYQFWTNAWDIQYTYPIYNFIGFGGVLLFALLPLTIYSMYRVKKWDEQQIFYVVWYLTLMPLIIYNIWRWWSFAIIPAILFSSSIISKWIDHHEKEIKT